MHIDESSDCKILPEIVYRFVSSRDTLNFLVSFLLKFGDFHTAGFIFLQIDRFVHLCEPFES